MQLFPSRRAARRAQTRLVLSFFVWTAVGFVACMAIIAIHYAFGGW